MCLNYMQNKTLISSLFLLSTQNKWHEFRQSDIGERFSFVFLTNFTNSDSIWDNLVSEGKISETVNNVNY